MTLYLVLTKYKYKIIINIDKREILCEEGIDREFINKNIKPNCKYVVAFVNPDYSTNIK